MSKGQQCTNSSGTLFIFSYFQINSLLAELAQLLLWNRKHPGYDFYPGYRQSTVMAAPGVRSFFTVPCESGAIVSLLLS